MKYLIPAEFPRLAEVLAEIFEKEESFLNDLDSRVGDGECGTNLRKAFRTASDRLKSQPPVDIGSLIEQLGTHLITSAGGTIGLLFGVGIRAAGKEVKGTQQLKATDAIRMGNAAIESIKARGKAQPGDKTFLDALIPAVAAFEKGVNGGAPPDKALKDMIRAARGGAEATRGMVAQRGRASYLGGRTLGHMDPGAMALVLALEGIERFFTAT